MTFRHLNRICEAGFENTVELKLEMAGCLNTVEFEEMMAVCHYSVSTSLSLFFANDAFYREQEQREVITSYITRPDSPPSCIQWGIYH